MIFLSNLTSPPQSQRPECCHPLEHPAAEPVADQRRDFPAEDQPERLGHPDTSAVKLSAKHCSEQR